MMPDLVFVYTNYRGEREIRHVKPISVWYGSTEYHPKSQWFLKAHCYDRDAERDFALTDCSSFATE